MCGGENLQEPKSPEPQVRGRGLVCEKESELGGKYIPKQNHFLSLLFPSILSAWQRRNHMDFLVVIKTKPCEKLNHNRVGFQDSFNPPTEKIRIGHFAVGGSRHHVNTIWEQLSLCVRIIPMSRLQRLLERDDR